MEKMTPHNIMLMLLALGILLGAARTLGEIAQRLRQPAVVGELLAGVLLGPTFLGSIAPDLCAALFPSQGANAVALDTISNLAIVLFLMVAGIEVDLSTIWKQGGTGLKVGIAGIVVPFAAGLAIALSIPGAFDLQEHVNPILFAMFIATAISISALPVIAKTLMDMDLYRSDLGMVVVSAAIFNDILGWIIFSVVLGFMENSSGGAGRIVMTILLTLSFAGFMLTLGRKLINMLFPFVQAYTTWPGGELSFAVILALLGAAFTEWAGIHAIFGAFLVGAAIGDSSHLRERTRVTIDNFVSSIFAPIFFAGIGLKVNFLEHFDLKLTLLILLMACIFKLAGGTVGARWGRMSKRESAAVGCAMLSVGAMGIIVGLLALESSIISHKLFVSIVVMAMITSMISGPAMRSILKPVKKLQLKDILASRLFVRDLEALSREAAIKELSRIASKETGLDPAEVEALVLERESAMSTGIGKGVAIPHSRIGTIFDPVIVVGISEPGIDFDAPDGKPANLIFLVLAPRDNPDSLIGVMAEIAGIFKNSLMLKRALQTRTFTDFMALIKSRSSGSGEESNECLSSI